MLSSRPLANGGGRALFHKLESQMNEEWRTYLSGEAPHLDVSAVMVTYRTGVSLRESIPAVLSQSGLTELIVVDNGNDDDTVGWLDRLASGDDRVRLIRPVRNVGFAAGCNRGAAAARGQTLAFVNPDLILPPDTLLRMGEIMSTHSDAWLFGGRLLNMDGTEQRGGRREILSPWRAFVELSRLDRLFPEHPYFQRLHRHEDEDVHDVVEVPTVSGAFMMIRKRHYETVNGMDDNMFIHFDDADLCIRIGHAGGRVMYCGSVPIYHYLSTSDVPRTFVEWHKTRSTSYYFHKHFRASYPLWALTLTSALLWLRFALITAKVGVGDLKLLLRGLYSGRRSNPTAPATKK
ncbi:Predicted glycosyltransferase [Paramagnetospirillum magneticum AMB-1]|uniref:Predicted glycosyltransferase n=2 Tax=Paramagnetospirillum magneticum TaxID=84159 RepID=Q2W8F4_PARM1|nr:Predicted glycosyltransferase [Paramagnetospirillum magneticum AMB-1]